jgi:rhodanese-related sulfurtransferase
MKAEAKKLKSEQREAERRGRRLKLGIIAVMAIVAAGFALKSYTPASTVNQSVSAESSFRRVSAHEVKPQFDRGEVTLIDVREADQFTASHIPGALQIPLARIEGEIPYLPKNKPIVTYCTCPAEESSGQAVQILRNGGITGAAALHGGLAAWRKAGYPVESGMPQRR